MYTGKTLIIRDRYKYNVDKVLNVNPNYLPYQDYLSEAYIYSCKNQINTNVENLITQLSDQLTYRQKAALREVSDILRYQWDFSLMFGIHEFRFEGAGSYRAGTSDDGYNSTTVTRISVDFTNLGGYHNVTGYPSDYNDGFGLYGAMSVIYRNGDILGVFFRASTLPDKIDVYDTISEGTFSFKVGTHPISGGYKALNLYLLNDFSADPGRYLPAAIDNNDDGSISGINSHKGYLNERGSEGCQTIAYENSDYDDYIALFNANETGRFFIMRYVNLPSV